MRRTHILHKKDNRRSLPSHHEAERSKQEPVDQRVIRWVRNGAGQQVLEIDGKASAHVRPFGEPRWDMLGEPVQPHIARIIGETDEHEFRSCDQARAFCEKQCLSL